MITGNFLQLAKIPLYIYHSAMLYSNYYYISEGSVSHINGVRPSFLEYTAVSRFVTFLRMLHTW